MAVQWHHLAVERILRETEWAFLLLMKGAQVWMPKSQIRKPESYQAGDESITVSITMMLAKKRRFVKA